MRIIYLCFPKMDRENPNTFLDFLVLHHRFWGNKCLSATLYLHKIHVLVVWFSIFLQNVCTQYHFSRTIYSPRNTDKLGDLISLFVRFCFFV